MRLEIKRHKITLLGLTMIIYALIVTFRYFIDEYVFMNVSLFLYAAIILVELLYLSVKKIRVRDNNFLILSLLMFLPSLYNNAYIADSVLALFAYYFLTVAFCCFLYMLEPNRDLIDILFGFFFIFGVITSIITWISFFNPDIYIRYFIPLMPKASQAEALNNFLRANNRMGLTTHYSHNAYYIILAILSEIYHYFNTKSKRTLVWIAFFISTMLIIGKRGHAIFFLAACMLAYFIFYKVKIKTILRFLGIFLVAIIFVMILIWFIPGANFLFERFDFTLSGSSNTMNIRLGMYKDIWNLFKNNGYLPIGWANYASSTNYSHPGVHNDYIQLFCETGILGFCFVIGSNVAILIKSIKVAHSYGDGFSFVVLIFNIFYLLYSLTGLPHFDVEVYMCFFIFNCFLYTEDRKVRYFHKKHLNED